MQRLREPLPQMAKSLSPVSSLCFETAIIDPFNRGRGARAVSHFSTIRLHHERDRLVL